MQGSELNDCQGYFYLLVYQLVFHMSSLIVAQQRNVFKEEVQDIILLIITRLLSCVISCRYRWDRMLIIIVADYKLQMPKKEG